VEGEIKNNKALKKTLHILIFQLLFLGVLVSCQEAVEHTAPAIHDRDSVATMTTYGVNTLISDSGVIKYRIVTEEWEVNTIKNPSFWAFNKGVFMEQFDEKFHVEAYVQADTAYFYDQQKLWELRSRVRILTKDGLRFSSEQLFWDQMKHEFYSNVFSKLVTPERTLQGSYFRSDERMTKYYVSNTKGSFEKGDFEDGNGNTDTARSAQDTVQKPVRQMATPQRRTTTSIPLTH
jgi:LPS export ABC transporter protein LptC